MKRRVPPILPKVGTCWRGEMHIGDWRNADEVPSVRESPGGGEKVLVSA